MIKMIFTALFLLSLVHLVNNECFCNARTSSATCEFYEDVPDCDFPVHHVSYLQGKTTTSFPFPPVVIHISYDKDLGWKIGVGVAVPGGTILGCVLYVLFVRRRNRRQPLWPVMGRVTRPTTIRPSIGVPGRGLAMLPVNQPRNAPSARAIPMRPPPPSAQAIPLPPANALSAQAIPLPPAQASAAVLPPGPNPIPSLHQQAAMALKMPKPAAGVGPGPKVPPTRPPWR